MLASVVEGIKDNCVLKAKADAQGSGQHRNCTLDELYKHMLKLMLMINVEAHGKLCGLKFNFSVARMVFSTIVPVINNEAHGKLCGLKGTLSEAHGRLCGL